MFNIFSDEVASFLRNHWRAVIATVDQNGQPMTSTVYYLPGDHHVLYFMTKTGTDKYKNIQTESRAALTVVDEQKPIAVNLIGTVTEVSDVSKRDDIIKRLLELTQKQLHDYAPIVKLHEGGFVALEFAPKHAQYTDFTKPMGTIDAQSHDY